MSDTIRIEDLPVEELRAALNISPIEADDDQLRAISEFVDRVGGLDNARLAIELLSELEDAA